MSIIQFANGTKVKFEGSPTPEDVDFVAKQVGIKPDAAEAPKVEQPKKTFGQKVTNAITTIFPGKQVGEAIGTLGGYIATPKEQKPFYDLKAPTPLQVVGDVAQGALMLGTGGVAAPTTAVSRVAGTSAPLLSKIATRTAETTGKRFLQNSAIGAGFGGTGAIAEGKSAGEVAKDTAIGGAFGGALGLGIEGSSKLISKLPKNRSVDEDIRDIFKGATGDVSKIEESSFKAKKGLELLVKESPNINIVNNGAPLGTNLTNKFNLSKAKPNEILSAITNMDKKIVSNARKATEAAKSAGTRIDTTEAKQAVINAFKNGDVSKATGSKMLRQLENLGDDPVKIHDWIQDVNVKYKKKYERGTIEDTITGKLADDIADTLRTKLDVIVDRKGYAEAFGNNQELKRMMVAIAKKANKQINFGDITSEAGLDAAISVLTGNPAYMARTAASGLFQGVVNKFKNNQGLRLFKSAANKLSKLPTEQKLPSELPKPSRLPALIPGKDYSLPKISSQKYQPIKLPTSARETTLGLNEIVNTKRPLPLPKPKIKTKPVLKKLNTTTKKADEFLRDWTNTDSTKKGVSSLKKLSPQEVDELAAHFKKISIPEENPSKTIILYRGTEKGQKEGLLDRPTAWTRIKEVAQEHTYGTGKVTKIKVTPDQVLVDMNALPDKMARKYAILPDEEEVILRPMLGESGRASLGTIGTGALISGAGVAGSQMFKQAKQNIQNFKEIKESQKSNPETKKLEAVKEAISQNEKIKTGEDVYKFHKFSGDKRYGDDLGKYQITSARLKEKSKAFLGRSVTDKEFLNSPELQEKFMDEQIKFLLKHNYSVAELIAAHRGGFSDFRNKKKVLNEREKYTQKALDEYIKQTNYKDK